MGETDETLLTVAAAARWLNVSKPTVYRRIAEGQIPAVRIGATFGPLRIPLTELRQWLYQPAESPAERYGSPALPPVSRAQSSPQAHGGEGTA